MQETKRASYTPGPWKVGGSLVYAKDGTEIARVLHSYDTKGGSEPADHSRHAPKWGEGAEANAALIEQAPALVEALRAATAFVELFTGNGVQEQPPAWAINEERGEYDSEAIAKHCRAVLARINGEG